MTVLLRSSVALSVVAAVIGLSSFAQAGITAISSPQAILEAMDNPPAAIGGYQMRDLTPVGSGAVGSTISLVDDFNTPHTLGVSDPVSHQGVNSTQYPIGDLKSQWHGWNPGYRTGSVFYIANPSSAQVIDLILPMATQAFYFYVEPLNYGPFNFAVTASGSAGSSVLLSQTVRGRASKVLFCLA